MAGRSRPPDPGNVSTVYVEVGENGGDGSGSGGAARLTEDDGAPVLLGRPVVLTLGTGAPAQSCTAATDAAGLAVCTIATVDQRLTPTGTLTVAAAFAGDEFYAASAAAGTVEHQHMTGTGFALAGTVQAILLRATVAPTPLAGPVRTADASAATPPCVANLQGLVSAQGLCAAVTTTIAKGSSTTTASVARVSVGLPGLPAIELRNLTSTSSSSCSGATGASTIGSRTIGGSRIVLSARPNTTISIPGIPGAGSP